MGAAMSGSYGRMLERARRAGAPCKPCWVAPEVTGGGILGPVGPRERLWRGLICSDLVCYSFQELPELVRLDGLNIA